MGILFSEYLEKPPLDFQTDWIKVRNWRIIKLPSYSNVLGLTMSFTMLVISIMSSLRTLLQVKFWSDDLIKILLISSALTCQLQMKLSLAFITAIASYSPHHQSIKEVKSDTDQQLKGVTITKKDMTSRDKKCRNVLVTIV